MNDVEKPFRWDLTRRNQLGKLIQGEKAQTYNAFSDQLLRCCAGVLAVAGDSDLIFVGRSPESIFDHLSGLLLNTSWFERLELLHFSIGLEQPPWRCEVSTISRMHVKSMRSYLRQLNLHPEAIATRSHPAALIDLVSSGETLGKLITFIRNWTEEIAYDWNAVSRRIRILGITKRTKTSPKTWRWQRHAPWLPLIAQGSVKNVSIPRELWDYLGDYQEKVVHSYTPSRWGDAALNSPIHDESRLRALRLAFELFELGRTKKRKQQFVSLLVKEATMKQTWFRMLVQELRP
jgi:hypothetical protein